MFNVVMLMIKQVTLAPLDSYERGIEGLMSLHPGAWDLVAVTYEICRSERWMRLYEVYMVEPPAGWCPTMSWDKVITHSSWGQDDMNAPRPFHALVEAQCRAPRELASRRSQTVRGKDRGPASPGT